MSDHKDSLERHSHAGQPHPHEHEGHVHVHDHEGHAHDHDHAHEGHGHDHDHDGHHHSISPRTYSNQTHTNPVSHSTQHFDELLVLSADTCCSDQTEHAGCCSSSSCQEEPSNAGVVSSEEILDLQAGEARTVFQVDGMDCGECARTVQRVVSKLNGVRDVAVNFSTTKMTVVHTAATAELGSIAKAVSQVGYVPTLLTTTLEEDRAGTPLPSVTPKHNLRTIFTGLSGGLLAIGMALQYSGVTFGNLGQLPMILVYALSIVLGGFYAARAGFYALKSWTLDMNFLMTVAALGAAVIGQWSEGATVVFLFAVGNWLQARTMERTRRSIRDLMNLTPKEALVRRHSQELKLSLPDIRVGDTIIVRPGERLPMDGVLTLGSSHVNQAPVTGESVPIYKQAGDTVYAGSLNEQGAFEYTVTKRMEDSTIQRMIHLVEEAQAQKAPSQQFVDRFATYYTPLVVLLAVLVALLPPLFQWGSFQEWLYRALVMLVIACPCALVISTPVSIVAAIGHAARNGVLIKGGAILEEAGRLQAVAFDKTGTLTEGKPHVVQMAALGDFTPERFFPIAVALESRSEHPLARAVLTHYQEQYQAPVPVVQNFRAVAGRGAEGVVDGTLYRIGSPAWMADLLPAQDSEPWNDLVQEQQGLGRTVVLLADEQRVRGLIAIADIVRTESQAALQHLKKAGVAHTVMLTGDHQRVAAAIAKPLPLDEVQAGLLPEEKLSTIRQLQNRWGHVAMVGDGINDAPALAAADIGIAMGGAGTDVALETADLVLMSDDLGKLPFAIDLSRRALRVIKQNIWFSVGVKAVFLALTLVGLSNLWMAVFADTGAALLVIANGMRLMKKRPH